MRTALILAGLLLAATACGSDPTGTVEPWGSAEAAAPEPVQRGLAAASEDAPLLPAGIATADLLECLVQGGLSVSGPYEREVAPGVGVHVLSSGITDVPEAAGLHAGLYLFPDGTTATAYADAALAVEVAEGEVDRSTATVSVRGSVAAVLERAFSEPSTAQQRELLDCLDDPAGGVAPPPSGTATLGSLMACLTAAGFYTQAEHGFVDELEHRVGRVTPYVDGGFGWSEVSYVYVYADAAGAETAEPTLTEDYEPGVWTRRGNTIARFWDPVDQPDAETAAVLGCLPD